MTIETCTLCGSEVDRHADPEGTQSWHSRCGAYRDALARLVEALPDCLGTPLAPCGQPAAFHGGVLGTYCSKHAAEGARKLGYGESLLFALALLRDGEGER